jgi:hypothetical protein
VQGTDDVLEVWFSGCHGGESDLQVYLPELWCQSNELT